MKAHRVLIAAALTAATVFAQPTTVPATRPDSTVVGRPQSGKMARRFLELHGQYVERARQGNVDVVFLGDSITQKWRDAPDIWKQRFEPIKAVNFGVMGNVIQHVLWRVEHGELDGISPKVVVLLIGTNNANGKDSAPIVVGIRHLIDVIHGKCPRTKVLLLAIFPRDKAGEANQTRVINEVNPELAKLDDGSSIRFLNINDKFQNADGTLKAELFADRLHPNPAGYQVWADAMTPLLTEMLKD